MVGFLVGFFDFSDLSSFDADFGIPIGIISYNAHTVRRNASVLVLGANRGHIPRHFWSAWWSDFWSNFGLPQFGADPVPSASGIT